MIDRKPEGKVNVKKHLFVKSKKCAKKVISFVMTDWQTDRHMDKPHTQNGYWKVQSKSPSSPPPPLPHSAPYYSAVDFHHFFWKKRKILDFTLVHHVLWKSHNIKFTLLYPILLHFLNKIQGGTLMIISKWV